MFVVPWLHLESLALLAVVKKGAAEAEVGCPAVCDDGEVGVVEETPGVGPQVAWLGRVAAYVMVLRVLRVLRRLRVD